MCLLNDSQAANVFQFKIDGVVFAAPSNLTTCCSSRSVVDCGPDHEFSSRLFNRNFHDPNISIVSEVVIRPPCWIHELGAHVVERDRHAGSSDLSGLLFGTEAAITSEKLHWK
jgi:hypothetical protein